MFITLLVYVDDILIGSNYPKAVEDLKVYLDKHFKLKDLGSFEVFSRFGGCKITKRAFLCVIENILLKLFMMLECLVVNQLELPWKPV